MSNIREATDANWEQMVIHSDKAGHRRLLGRLVRSLSAGCARDREAGREVRRLGRGAEARCRRQPAHRHALRRDEHPDGGVLRARRAAQGRGRVPSVSRGGPAADRSACPSWRTRARLSRSGPQTLASPCPRCREGGTAHNHPAAAPGLAHALLPASRRALRDDRASLPRSPQAFRGKEAGGRVSPQGVRRLSIQRPPQRPVRSVFRAPRAAADTRRGRGDAATSRARRPVRIAQQWMDRRREWSPTDGAVLQPRPRLVPSVLHLLTCDAWAGTEVQVASQLLRTPRDECHAAAAILQPPGKLSAICAPAVWRPTRWRGPAACSGPDGASASAAQAPF